MTTPIGRREGDLVQDRVIAAIGDLYEIEGEIGRGGMAVVYGARDVKLRRRVAVKVLPPELAYRADVRTRFVREAQMAAQLSHPHIVPIYAVDERQGITYFVMGLVEGETLAQRLAREPHPSIDFIRRVLREVADALAYAHAHGVVHRDVKPDNILLDGPNARALVTDFGIARAAEGDTRLTVTGVAVGTPAYMSPEQAMGEKEVDGRADLYSLGVVGYQMLAGELPFRATNTPAMMMKHLSEVPPPLAPRRPDCPRNLVAAIERALAKKPELRYAGAAAFRDALASTAVPVHVAPSVPPRAPSEYPAAADQAPPPPRIFPDPIRDPAGFGAEVGMIVGSAVGSLGLRVGEQLAGRVRQREPQQYPPAVPGMQLDALPPMPPFPRYPAGEPDARRKWKDAQRAWREELRARGLSQRGDIRSATSGGAGFLFAPKPLDVRVLAFRRKMISSMVVMSFMTMINVTTGRFPWVLFPIFAIMMGLWRRYDSLAAEGVTLGDAITGRTPDERAGRTAGPVTTMDGLALRVGRFKRRLLGTAAGAAAAMGSFAIGSAMNLDAMIPVFVASLVSTFVFGISAINAGLDLKRIGISLGSVLGRRWRDDLHVDHPHLAMKLMAGELDQSVPEEVKQGLYGRVVIGAAADRAAILETISRLGEADRAMLPEVLPTVRALEERVIALALALHRMEGDVSGTAVDALDRRLAELVAAGTTGPQAGERERTRQLLERQRSTLTDLAARRDTLRAQMESAALLLQTMKLDLFKLRSAGVSSAMDDVTSATQEARALSREIGTVLEAADEVRAIERR